MLTKEAIMQNRENFIGLLKCVDEIDVESFVEYLDSINFFVAPASTKYHCSYEGGLCEHSLDVFYEFDNLVRNYFGDSVPGRTIVILGLLHDIAKANYYEQYVRNVKNEQNGQWEKVLEYRVKDGSERPTFGTNAVNSYMAISKYIQLKDDEAVALLNYNCGMDDNYSNKDLNIILSKYPLVTLLHSADMISTYILERR